MDNTGRTAPKNGEFNATHGRHGSINPLAFLLLTLAPIAVILHSFYTWLPADHYLVALPLIALLWLRTAVSTSAKKLLFGKSKGRRNFAGRIDEEQLDYLREHINDEDDRMSAAHIRQFALSVLATQTIRRRVTDEYSAGRRTLTKKVVLELDHRVLTRPDNSARQRRRPDTSRDIVVAMTLPHKGALYDQLEITDGEGKILPSLSHLEYRMLATRTLRVLLRAALHGGRMTEQARRAESLALREIIRFAGVERMQGESRSNFAVRVADLKARKNAAYDAIREIKGADPRYLDLAIEFTAKLAGNYAIVVLAPAAELQRSVIVYTREIIPDLQVARFTTLDGVRERIRMYLGTRPNSLVVSARNAVSCQSYHLVVKSSPDLFLGDFDTSSIRTSAHRGDSGKRLAPYWRVRGRRGQDYFHMYTRALESNEGRRLNVRLNFFEVPPGSIGRAALAALAICLVTMTIGLLVVTGRGLEAVDTPIVSFLLAVPGIAAAWMGFETRNDQLFEGTVVSRLSLVVTFALSFAAAVLLMAQKTGLVPVSPMRIFVFVRTDPYWSALGVVALIHLATVMSIWWLRNRVYRTLTTRPVGDSAVFA